MVEWNPLPSCSQWFRMLPVRRKGFGWRSSMAFLSSCSDCRYLSICYLDLSVHSLVPWMKKLLIPSGIKILMWAQPDLVHSQFYFPCPCRLDYRLFLVSFSNIDFQIHWVKNSVLDSLGKNRRCHSEPWVQYEDNKGVRWQSGKVSGKGGILKIFGEKREFKMRAKGIYLWPKQQEDRP